jgi:hypothetical protein
MDSTAGGGQQGDGSDAGSEGELVFNESEGGMDGAGAQGGDSDALPDFSEEEVLDEALESFEEAMESAAAEAQGGEQGGSPGGSRQAGEAGAQSAGEGEPGSQGAQGKAGSQTAGTGQAAGAGGDQGGAGSQTTGAGRQGGGTAAGGYPAGNFPAGSGGGSGTLTDAEQVAILDEQLNRGTGEFDDLILEEREVLRRTAKGNAQAGDEQAADSGAGGYSGGGTGGFQVPPMAGGGGGGQGGPLPNPRSGDYDQDIPEQVAVYAPPADIPDGTDDDVVARQLREAAMREPDPKLREKLWDEYRKYKGIE